MAPRRKQRPRPGATGKKGPAQAALAARAKRQQERDDTESSYSGSESGSEDSRTSDAESSATSSGPSDEDDPRQYKHGGYHPVSAYQLYNGRYRVLSKLGAGAFSTVWLCADEKDCPADGPQLVAMKVCKSRKSVTEQALDEIELLERLDNKTSSSPHVVQMRGHFWHSGPNGRHKCMVFEVMGENLLALVKFYDYNGLPLDMVRRISRHTLRGLAYIHSRGVIHTDVKLENVLVQRHDLAEMVQEARRAHRAFMETKADFEGMSKSQKKRAKKKEKQKTAKAAQDDAPEASPAGSSSAPGGGGGGGGDDAEDADEAVAQACGKPIPPVRQRERFKTFGWEQCFAKLADFGNGVRSNRKVTDDIQTRQYRSPEILIGQEWDETADVWSAACMFFELATGEFLFDPRRGDDWSRDEDHIALIVELLGSEPPKEWTMGGKYAREFFTNSGKLKHIKKFKFWPLSEVLVESYSFDPDEAKEFDDFLSPMLRWRPCDRQPAAEALQNRWVQPREGEAPDDVECSLRPSAAVDFPPRTAQAQQEESSSLAAEVAETPACRASPPAEAKEQEEVEEEKSAKKDSASLNGAEQEAPVRSDAGKSAPSSCPEADAAGVPPSADADAAAVPRDQTKEDAEADREGSDDEGGGTGEKAAGGAGKKKRNKNKKNKK